MKKYIRYVAIGTVMAISGFMTEANAGWGLGSVMHKVQNAVDHCNAGAMGSAKGLSLVEECLPDADTAAKHAAGAAAFWSAHCQGEDATTNADACGIAATAANLPDGFVCDEAAGQAEPIDENVKKYCFNNLGLKKNESFAWAFYHQGSNCTGKKPDSKYKTQCKAVKGAFAKIATMPQPTPPAAPAAPADPAADPAADSAASQ